MSKFPDALFRNTKAIVSPPEAPKRLSLPLVGIGKGKTFNLKGFDFDELLG